MLALPSIVHAKLGPVSIGHVAYGVACVAAAGVIGVAGYASTIVQSIHHLGGGASLGSNGPQVGEMNILVMGLESRTDFHGNVLDSHLLNVTHSGSESAVTNGQEGSQDTNTLILIHIPAGGKKAVGFSIPRDDVVNYPQTYTVPTGSTTTQVSEGKIDAAYADGYNQSLWETQNDTNRTHRYDEANQAGQLAEVETVESVTGVHIDHFVVSNIVGFYELASQFGGLEVCIKPAPAQAGFSAGANLSDYDPQTGTDNSGFNAVADGYNRAKGGPQYLHLYASQALAYVRSRDTLPGVDVGRTARQQAAMDYIVWKLEHGNILGSLSAVTTLLNNAQGYLEYDSGWNLLDFAQGMGSLTSSGLHFTTLPEASVNSVYVPSLGGRQSVDLIDTTLLQQQVNEAFYGQPAIPATARTETVDVYNGGSTTHLATDVRADLAALGYKAGQAAAPAAQSQAVTDTTQVFYGGGGDDQANAQVIASLVGEATGPTSLSSLPAGHIEVLLGKNVGQTPPGLLLTGWDYITPATWISDATGNNQKIPPNMTAAATAAAKGSSYEGSLSAITPGAGASVSAVPDGPTTAAAKAPSAKTPASDKATLSAHSSPAQTAAPATPASTIGQYGIPGCPY
jgi:anionic cell wall polymer biosynthesis LytR-Cps2A-Psr (LCP) family protein